MRGRQVFMESLIAHGVEYIFGNPGTTESPILDALLDYPQLRYIVALHEGVALGAASYYAQTSGKPAVVNVHVAPGLGNALGMLYNALQGARAAARDRRTAGHAPAAARAGARPRPGGDGRAAHQVERPGRARRRVRADHPPRAQDRHRPARGTGLRRAADRRARAGDRPRPVRRRAGSTARPSPIPRACRRPRSCCAAPGGRCIVVGDDAASAAAEVAALAEQLGAAGLVRGAPAPVRCCRPPTRTSGSACPSTRPPSAGRWTGADVVLLVGGPFFEEVWYAPGSPLPPGAVAIQVESSPERLAHNLPVSVGLVSHPRARWPRLRAAIEREAPAGRASARRRRAATMRSARSRPRTRRPSAPARPSAGITRRSRCRA